MIPHSTFILFFASAGNFWDHNIWSECLIHAVFFPHKLSHLPETFFASVYLTTFLSFYLIVSQSPWHKLEGIFVRNKFGHLFFLRETYFFCNVSYKHGLFMIFWFSFNFFGWIIRLKLWISCFPSFEWGFDASISWSDSSKFIFVSDFKIAHFQAVHFWLNFPLLFAISLRSLLDEFFHVFFISKEIALASLMMNKTVLGKGSDNLDASTWQQ